jgi:UDP-N-acetylmuramate--alanine ligase|tara:strand:+ start:4690 stop:6099 length:1410 start_codon:yes stop_codon:yes gene_type:complete
MNFNLANKEIIHFIGIGGIGMSGLALIMKNIGFNVQGSDINQNQNIIRLKKLGIKIFIGHKNKNLKKSSVVVISSAIKNNNPELKFAKKNKLPIYKRGDMLANIFSLKKNIVISGSHGKTTTTSLISTILNLAKFDATTINGGVINQLQNSAKLGKGEWSVLESDESDGSFLKIPVTYSVVTNIDKEHLDYYKSFKNLFESFRIFVEKTPPFGKSFICIDDTNNKKLLNKLTINNFYTYGFNNKSNFKIILKLRNSKISKFDLKIKLLGKKTKLIKNFQIPLLGNHNIKNATAAIAICLTIGIKINIIKDALKNFSGVQRRFIKVFTHKKNDFYDDYAHHPTEITELLKGVKAVSKKRKIISIFQPHRYSRLRLLKKEFSKCFNDCDEVILCPIYSAGEKNDENYDSYKFGNLIIKNSKVNLIIINHENDLLKYFKKNLFKDELIISMGAGTISTWIKDISQNEYFKKN